MKLMTRTFPTIADHDAGALLDIVIDALDATGRIPATAPDLPFPEHYNRDNIAGLEIEAHPDGWVANVSFGKVPRGEPDSLGTPDATPLPCEREAFLAGAEVVCAIVTGSPELPFFVAGDRLMVVVRGVAGP